MGLAPQGLSGKRIAPKGGKIKSSKILNFSLANNFSFF